MGLKHIHLEDGARSSRAPDESGAALVAIKDALHNYRPISGLQGDCQSLMLNKYSHSHCRKKERPTDVLGCLEAPVGTLFGETIETHRG